MPLYEYKCHSCGKSFEALQKFSDEPLKTHDECGGEVERLLSAPAFHLKGSGWYATDYGKGGVIPKGPDAKSESGGDGKSGDTKSAEKTSDTKSSETKTETKPTESKPAPVAASDAK